MNKTITVILNSFTLNLTEGFQDLIHRFRNRSTSSRSRKILSLSKDKFGMTLSGIGITYALLAADPRSVFGTIKPPNEILPLIRKGGEGAGGISLILSNLVLLIYMVAGVVFVFMLLWGAFQWLTSGGEKEAVAQARGRIINAIIGIILFAVAFAIIQIVGTFTGFSFFRQT